MKCDFNDNDLKNLNEIKNFLEENDIEYSTKYDNFCLWYDNPEGKRSYEIVYVPSLQYPMAYHNFNIEGVDKDYFFKLSYKAENENNSFKLWVKDYEWENLNKKEVLKSYILYAANKIQKRWYARECEIRVVDSKDGSDFELENCFYGKRGATLRLGLYSKKEKYGIPIGSLLMIYTFGKNFFAKKDGIIEVIRVGTMKYCQVIGGASKLLNHFLKNYKTLKIGKETVKVKQLKFYSDYDHNIGGSMDNLGFEFQGYSGGGFMNYWVEEKVVKHRQPMKHKWVMEQKMLGKCFAIPNSGVKIYILNVE
jgi:hypothetical protein